MILVRSTIDSSVLSDYFKRKEYEQKLGTRDIKWCINCEQWKKQEDFYKRGDKFRSWCKICGAAAEKTRLQDSVARAKMNATKRARRNKILDIGISIGNVGHIIFKYKITFEEFVELYKTQNGCCGICGVELWNGASQRKGLKCHVDHDHITGKVRGILCHNCNIGIGRFNDNISLLYSAIKYLQRSQLSIVRTEQEKSDAP